MPTIARDRNSDSLANQIVSIKLGISAGRLASERATEHKRQATLELPMRFGQVEEYVANQQVSNHR